MTEQSATTVIFSPHVDDEVLGCFSWLDDSAHVVWFGVEEFHEVDRATRLSEAEAVAAERGFSFSTFAEPVNQYALRPILEIAEQAIAEWQPQCVLLPCRSYNQDHRTVHDAVHTAVRPHDRLPFVPRVLEYEQPHAALWPTDSFAPQYFRAIDLEAKLATWRLHASQNRAHRSGEHIATLAKLRGQQSGQPCAEAFSVLRWVER